MKCKDCKNIYVLKVYSTIATLSKPDDSESVSYNGRRVRLPYCPVVDSVVDLSAERDRGCYPEVH